MALLKKPACLTECFRPYLGLPPCTQIFRAIHNCYLAYLADPFNDLPSSLSKLPRSEVGTAVSARPIRNKRFDKHMELIAGFS